MNNWRNINEEKPSPDTELLRVKYVYFIQHTPLWATFPSCVHQLVESNVSSGMPFAMSLSPHQGVGVIHIDPPEFGDDGFDPLSGGFRWSDLKGIHQKITHWMYMDEPYDETEENVDGRLLMDYDGKVKEPTKETVSMTVQEFDKPNKMRRVYNAENVASVINNDPRFKKENNMKFVQEITIKTFDVSCFEEGAAYLCTPLDYSDQKFIGIFTSGDSKTISFAANEYPKNNIKRISIDDAHNWTIEKMIEPMTDEELQFLQDLITKYTIGAFGANDGSNKHITDSILQKLGFNVKE